jgi:hypothetical protein
MRMKAKLAMKSKCVAIAPLLALSTLVAMTHLDAQAKPADSEEIAHIQSGQTVVEGVVTRTRSGLYTVRTATGTNYRLAQAAEVRSGRDLPKVGDEMILWINEGNQITDVSKKGANHVSPRFVSGTLVSINYGQSQVTLSMAAGEESFKLRPESRMFRDMAVGAPVTIAVNKDEEVMCIHVGKGSEVPRRGLSHPDNGSALVGFRHLGHPE